MTSGPYDILKKYWGFDHFRPRQEDIINNILQHRDTMALLPTGGGKSLCYQLPALLLPGITIVVSPLIALMKDQVMQLQQRGIKAMHIASGIHYNELGTKLDNCIYGGYKLLYLSPERLQQDMVIERLAGIQVSLIAIDEAHCISQWGHDFRPAYRNLSRLREILPDTPYLALTATATQMVTQDIMNQLEMPGATLFKTSFKRDNLAYIIHEEQDKHGRLAYIFKKHQGSGIVYVRSRKSAQLFADFLKTKQIKAHYYHGGLSNAERDEKFKEWSQGKVQVMVATSAFGMGIDKADVHTVVHVEIPESIESYFQEAGRAGRDGNDAHSIMLFSESDKKKLNNQFVKVIPSIKDIAWVYKKLCAYFSIGYGEGHDETYRFNFMEFCSTYKLNTIITFNALQSLDRNSVLQLSQEFYRRATFKFETSPVNLTYYLIKNPGMDEIVKTILRTYGGIFDQAMTIDHATVAKKAARPVKKVHEVLITLEKDEMGTYDHKSHDTAVTFLEPREDRHTINRIAPDIKVQNKRKIEQVNAMLRFIENDNVCRNVQLLNYFDEKTAQACGICDVCQKKKRDGGGLAFAEAKNVLLLLLEQGPATSRELETAMPAIAGKDLLRVLQILLEDKKIRITPANRYELL
ncbi:MAG: recombinase RecQ [Cytophagaceae bacterium]|mgnify:FL=1|nr:recombinase RecQ [Cytophagaceae bacterium]